MLIEYNLGLNLFDAPDMGKDLFIGRRPEVEEMKEKLQPETMSTEPERRVLVLGGMGGIGKTQLSIAYAKEYRSFYSSIFWLNASSQATVTTSLRDIACRIMPVATVNPMKDEELWIHVSNWLSEQDNTRWLLIFDNYDDPNQYDIKTFSPAAAQGSIIVTTRQPRKVNGKQLRVGSMKETQDGLWILNTRSGRKNVLSGKNPPFDNRTPV